MTGFQSRVRDVINQAAPTHGTVAVADRGLLHFLDPSMTGNVRFMQKAGYPFPLLTPQMSADLAAAAAAGTQTVLLQGTRLLSWLIPGMGVSFELLEDAVVDTVQDQGDGTILLALRSTLTSSHATGSKFHIRSFPVYPTSSSSVGDGAIGTPAVTVTSAFLLVPGDVFTIDGATFTLSYANLVSVLSGVYTYEVKLDDTTGFPALSPSSTVTVTAKAAYQSDLLTVPQVDFKSMVMGPVAVDWVSGPMVADYRPMPESTVYLEEYNVANHLLVPFREVHKNDTLSRFPIGRDQMLFWSYAEGGTNWDGTYLLLKAFDSGRVHVWTPCRPALDAAPLATVAVTVPSFSPYQVNLLNKVLSDVTVYDAVTKAVVPATDYTVNTATGALQFIAAYASTPVIVVYRPRLEWQIPARADDNNVELTVTVGREPKQVFNLGPANTSNLLTIEVLTEADVDQLHVTARRADDSSGAFTVYLGEWQPRGGVTGVIRYTLSTAADVDYDWASSGLLFKPLWPTLELLRARLDGTGALARSLDAGRMLLDASLTIVDDAPSPPPPPPPPPPPLCPIFTPGDESNPYVGNLLIASDADVATFMAGGYDAVLGDLDIVEGAPGAITSLAGLSTLLYVSGYLNIAGNVGMTSLMGLDSLRRVDGAVYVVWNTGIPNLLPLDGVTYIGGSLIIQGNTGLVSLNGCFACLTDVVDIDVLDNPDLVLMNAFDSLASSCTWIGIRNNPLLTSIASLAEPLTSLLYGLSIENNPSLTTATNLVPNVVNMSDSWAELRVANCASLTTLTGFDSLESIGGDSSSYALQVYDTAVTAIPAFSVLESIGGMLRVEFNTGSFSMAGAFPALLTISSDADGAGIRIANNTGLTSVDDAFPLLTGAGWVDLFSNPALTSADRFCPALVLYYTTNYPYVAIQDNAALTSVSDSFTSITQCNYLEMHDNLLCVDLSGSFTAWETGPSYSYLELYGNGALDITGSFTALQNLRYIEVYGNGSDGILSLAGAFPSLTHLDYLEVYNCPGLTSAAGMCPALTDVTFSPGLYNGYIELFDNPNLTTLAGSFAALTRLMYIEVNNCDLLTNLGWSALTTLSNSTNSNGRLRLIGNAALTDLTSLAALTTIKTRLRVEGCTSLTNVSTLLNVNGASFAASGVREVVFLNNTLLPTAAQAQAVITNLVTEGYTGPTTNSGNGPG